MTVRYYSSVAAETTLVGSITNSSTTVQLASVVGLPPLVPYTIALDYEGVSEELVEVTAAAGTTLTVTRAIDGTSATSHNTGARVRHVSSARDFADSRSHENSTAAVHGLASGEAVVGVSSTQTLSNKTLNNATGSLSDIDIFASAAWVTTVNGNIAGTADLMKWYRGPSEPHYVAAVQNNGNLVIRNKDAAADSVFNTARIQVVLDNGTTEVFRVLSGGQVDIFGKDPTASVLDVQAAAAQSGDIMRVQNSSAATLFAIQNAGRMLANRAATIAQPGTTSGAVLQVGGTNPGYTGNLTQWVDPSNAIVARVTETGSFITNSDINVGGSLINSTDAIAYRPTQTGNVNATFAGDINKSVAVTFAQPFPSTPSIVISKSNAPGGSAKIAVSAINASTTGFTAFFNTVDAASATTTSLAATWIAVGPQ